MLETIMWHLAIFVATALLAYGYMPHPQPGPYRTNFHMWFWESLAWLVSRKPVARWIIRRAQKTPYTHIPGYMNRWWLFNRYQKKGQVECAAPIPWLPSIRVHHILRRDNDRHPHDHPWNARTIVLQGWYDEHQVTEWVGGRTMGKRAVRSQGYTGPINYGEYHQITEVSEGGVWTLFFTFGYIGTWGFLVDGEKVPWHDYMKMYPEKPWAVDDVSNAKKGYENG